MILHAAPLARGVRGLGPGTRIVLWTQGCTLACPGCMTPEYFAPREGSARAVAALGDEIAAAAGDHDGLTVSGGEPFQQAAPLAALLTRVRADTTLDVMIYSGYRMDELLAGSQDDRRLLELADLLMDGRFQRESGRTMPWRGSDNQRLYALTPRGRTALRTHPPAAARQIHVEALGEGFRVSGIPAGRDREAVERRLAEMGLTLRRKA